MKVLSQSSTVAKQPYFHLAYLAATSRTPQGGLFSMALVVLTAWIVFTFKTSTIKTKKGRVATAITFRALSFKKVVLRVLLLILGSGVLFFSFYFGTDSYIHRGGTTRIRLFSIGIDLLHHAKDDNGDKLPDASNWCDELLEWTGNDAKRLHHPDVRIGVLKVSSEKESHYAINSNIYKFDSVDDIPADMVVLFESKKGWNQAGGVELATMEYNGGAGCYVFFGEGQARFVEADEIGDLRW